MKCPHCGNEMVEGHLICETCGEEIRIVPDFEPEIENSITETLSTLAAEQDGADNKEMQQADGKQEDKDYGKQNAAGVSVQDFIQRYRRNAFEQQPSCEQGNQGEDFGAGQKGDFVYSGFGPYAAGGESDTEGTGNGQAHHLLQRRADS